MTATDQPHTFNPVVVAHRIVQSGMLLSLIWKWSFFKQAARVYARIPLEDSFFPEFFQSVWTVSLAFLITVAVIAINIGTASRILQLTCSVVTLVGTSILCLHQASYNDVTFMTVWWTSLWALWFVHRMTDADQVKLLERGALLGRMIVTMILLGGAVGKWTNEYWSGEVFFDIYFRDRDFWLFNILRANFDAETLPEIAKWYSRFVVATETIAGLTLWILPARLAALVGVTLLASIALMSNFLLFSVLFTLMGLIAVGYLVQARTATE